jgi:nucleotide-binding universal stress UspA family protein
MYERILVPLDGSAHAELALDTAIEIARRCGAKLILTRVAGHPITHFYVEATDVVAIPSDDSVEHCAAYLAEVSRRLDAEGIRSDFFIGSGMAADEILRQADLNAVNLIVIATHGRSGLGRWMLGSVADRVAQGAKVPVLLVRRHDRPAPGRQGAEQATTRNGLVH